MRAIDAEILALQLMREHGVTARGFKFRWTSSRRARGVTRFRRPANTTTWLPVDIGLSRPLTEASPESQVRETILHEIAHALAGHSAGHGYQWKRIALSIGADGKPCDDSAEGRVLAKAVARYVVWCDTGSHAVHHVNSTRYRVDRRICGTHRTALRLMSNNPTGMVK